MGHAIDVLKKMFGEQNVIGVTMEGRDTPPESFYAARTPKDRNLGGKPKKAKLSGNEVNRTISYEICEQQRSRCLSFENRLERRSATDRKSHPQVQAAARRLGLEIANVEVTRKHLNRPKGPKAGIRSKAPNARLRRLPDPIRTTASSRAHRASCALAPDTPGLRPDRPACDAIPRSQAGSAQAAVAGQSRTAIDAAARR